LILCKQLPISKIEDGCVKQIADLYFELRDKLPSRYNHEPWKSINLIVNGVRSPIIHNFPGIHKWYAELPFEVENMYISMLAGMNQIPWHVDMTTDVYSPTILTAIRTSNSFVEFENYKYSYKDGFSYAIRSAHKHRVMNLSNEVRIMLCTTPRRDR